MGRGAIDQIAETLSARKAREKAAKALREVDRAVVTLVDGFDATPERIAKEPSDIVKGAIDGSNRVPNARRFKSCRIRALYMNRAISLRGKTAADFFSEICEQARPKQKVTANLEPHIGSNIVFAFLPVNLRQYDAAKLRDRLLESVPSNMRGYVLRLCAENKIPPRRDRAAQRMVRDLAFALEKLADAMKIPA